MRLIDADALKEYLKSYTGMFTDELGFVVALEAVLNGIDFQPTIEAESVRHGEWVSLEADISLFACSNCGHKILRAECNYCPKCGAKMDGGNNEQERTD